MLYFVHLLNALLMIALPIALGVFLWRRLGVRWTLFGIGAITFVASQAVHIPVNAGLTLLFGQNLLATPPGAWRLPFNATVLGLTAGLSEELARYIVYRWWIKSARTWREALMFGAGHGGIEAIIFGVLAGVAFAQLAALRNSDLSFIPAEQRAAAAQQIADYWSATWYASLLGAVERVFALCLHLSMAVTVLQAFTRRNPLWLAAAIVWHAAADAVAVFAAGTWGVYWTEAIVGVFAVASIGIIFALRPPAGETMPQPPPVSQPPTSPAHIPPPDPEAELRRQIEETRYTTLD